MDHADDATLVARAQAGERAAFTLLVDRYWPRVYRWLYGVLRNQQGAEDLCQDAFVKAWVGLGELQDRTRFRPWLFRIVRNCWTDRQRMRREKTLPLPELACRHDPAEPVLDREGAALLDEALARLPDEYRAAFLLWTQEGLPYATIAEVLATTEETARWRVCKARRLLLQQLSAYLDRKTP